MVHNPQRCSLKFEKDALLSLHVNILPNMWGFHEWTISMMPNIMSTKYIK